jgi:VCBS repeat-containing protein
MRRKIFSVTASCIISFFITFKAHAQVSFFQPPVYAGTGNVFAGDFNGDGKIDLLSSDGTLELGNGDGTFTLGTPVSGGALAVGDFNGDGKLDVLQQGTGTLLVLLGNGDGTFKPAISTASGASLSSVTAVDLNRDSKVDVVGVFNNMLVVYLSKGDGTFAPGVSYNIGVIPPSLPGLVSFGDFNGDSRVDVVVNIVGDNVAGSEVVLLGNGDGTLQPPKSSSNVLYPGFGCNAVGDFNGDGKLDLAVCGMTATYVLLGNGDGTFQAPTTVFSVLGSMVAADVNGDGKLDLIVESDPTIGQVYLGNGDGTFSNTSKYVLNFFLGDFRPAPSGLATGDFNGDGKLDIAMGNAVLLSNGDGTFQGIPLGTVPNSPGSFTAGRFDNSSATPGVALLSNQQIGAQYFYDVYILHNDGKGKLSLAHTYSLQVPGSGIATADFNGDGNLDLLVVGSDPINSNWSYSVLLGNGDGSFQAPLFYPQNPPSGTFRPSIVVADFNNDQKPDVAVSLPGTVALLLGNGNGTFAAPVYIFDGAGQYLVAGDFNSDGKLDIAAGGLAPLPGSATWETAVLYGNGDGTFQPAVFPTSLTNFAAQFTADLNNDGKPDLVSQNQVALGNGDGTFALLSPLNGDQVTQVADLNGDGRPDLFVTEFGGGSHPLNTGVLLGNGDGTFASPVNVPISGLLSTPVVADMNGDGRPDLIFGWTSFSTCGQGCGGVGVMLNTTAPGFTLQATPLSPPIVTAGNSATTTVNVTRTFGFTGAVALICEGLPPGGACHFNPASVPSASSTSMLTVTTSASVAPGTYALQIQGSAGALTTAVPLSLDVQPPPDFTVGISPASQSLTAGESTTYTLTLTPVGGFKQAVTLSCTGAPAKATCSTVPSPVPLDGSSSSQVQINITTTASSVALPYFSPWNRSTPITMAAVAAFTCILAALIVLVNSWRARFRWAFLLLVLITLVGIGCGGGGSSSGTTQGTPTGTYILTVNATSGSLSHATTISLTVQ